MQDLKVGIIQSHLIWEDKAANRQHVEDHFFSKIEPDMFDLVLLPEMFNTGFSMRVETLAETMEGETLIWLKKWAGQLGCAIGGSLIITENGHYFNRFVVVSGDTVLATYNKRHLFRMAEENNYFTAGSNQTIVEIKGWRLMLQVCYDLRFPVFSRNRVVDNQTLYDALIYVANWPQKRAFIWKNLIQARAIENQAYTIGVNRVGEDGQKIAYSGDSVFVDPWGNVLTQLSAGTEKFESLTLSGKVIDEIRANFPAYLDSDSFSIQ